MKKLPTLFEKEYRNNQFTGVSENVTKGFEWVLKGEGIATVKFDGACCAIINNEFYKRYDAKHNKVPPEGVIPCCEADSITGHHPHWVKIDFNNPSDKWFCEAYFNSPVKLKEGTYETIGPHFSANPYKLKKDILVKHGEEIINIERSYEKIKEYLENNFLEWIVFWKDGEPQCKIRKKDFRLIWK